MPTISETASFVPPRPLTAARGKAQADAFQAVFDLLMGPGSLNATFAAKIASQAAGYGASAPDFKGVFEQMVNGGLNSSFAAEKATQALATPGGATTFKRIFQFLGATSGLNASYRAEIAQALATNGGSPQAFEQVFKAMQAKNLVDAYAAEQAVIASI